MNRTLNQIIDLEKCLFVEKNDNAKEVKLLNKVSFMDTGISFDQKISSQAPVRHFSK